MSMDRSRTILTIRYCYNTRYKYGTSLLPSSLSLSQGKPNLDWFPRLRCMSLVSDEPEQEQNEMKDLQFQLSETTNLVKTLSHQLKELRDKVGNLKVVMVINVMNIR